MPLFPQFGSAYASESHRDVLARMEAFYAESITINQSFWGEADTDTRFEAGDQTMWNDLYGNLPLNRRKQFNFNRIRPTIEMIGGYQRRNRKSTIATPVENADAPTADQFTKTFMWLNQREGISETISDAFHGALVTGMNLLQVWVDHRSDPISGDIKVDNCSYNSFLIDPFFRKADLSDCNALWKRSYLTKRECLSLLSGYSEEIMGLQGHDNRDGKFQFMTENYNYGMKNLLTYDEFWYKSSRPQKMLIDTQTGECLEWKSTDEPALVAFLSRYPQIIEIDQDVSTVKMAIVVQGKVMYDGLNPMGIDIYPFIPVLGYYEPQMPYFPQRIQGVVRGLRDAQYLYNRRRCIELDILESQINSGFKYKENALVNPKDVFLSGQGRGLALKEEAQMTDVEQIRAPDIPPGMLALSESLSKEINQISGVNEELLGSAIDDKAGVLAMLRQGAGLTTLQRLFDQLDHSQRLLGRVLLKLIQANFTPGKMKRILGEEPSQQFYSKAFGNYDVMIEEGFNTTTQKQMNFAQLLQLKEAGVDIDPAALLEAATIQNKSRLVKEVQERQKQAADAQAKQDETMLKLQEAQTKVAMSTAAANEGLGMERTSRVMDNQAQARERDANAARNKEQGFLDLVKALKEIEGIDLKHLTEIVKLTQSLQATGTTPEVTPTSPAPVTSQMR